MNKQQLASKIWESANKMRSKIEANEYKDYILGFIFYKFLSNKELKILYNMGYSEEDLKGQVTEENQSLVRNLHGQDTAAELPPLRRRRFSARAAWESSPLRRQSRRSDAARRDREEC